MVRSRDRLWSLLDAAGAAACWRGAEEIERAAEPAAAVVRTVLRVHGARIECRDALVEGGLVRLLRADDADLEVTHELALGGFDQAWGTWDGPNCRMDSAVVTDVEVAPSQDDVIAEPAQPPELAGPGARRARGHAGEHRFGAAGGEAGQPDGPPPAVGDGTEDGA